MARTKTAPAFKPAVIAKFVRLQQKVYDAQKKLDEMEAANPGICQAYFSSLTTKLFEENPRLRSFTWNQYTPSWNDGDACTFSAHTDYPDINGACYDDIMYGDSFEEKFENDASGAAEAPLPLTKEEAKALGKVVVDFLRQFKDTQLEHWFGDGVEVTCTRKGVTLSDYEGDY